MSAVSLPEPEAWRGNRTRFRVLGLFFVAVGAFFGQRTVIALVDGRFMSLAFFGGFLLALLLPAIGIMRAAFGRVPVDAGSDESGTTFVADRRLAVLTYFATGIFLFAGTVFVIGVPFGMIDTPDARYWRLSPIGMAFGVALVFWRVVVALRRGGFGYLEISPDGVEYADAARTDFYGWDDIADVTDSAEKTRTRKAVVLSLVDGEEKVIEGMDLYVPRGSARYWMIRHYWRHPEDRSELADNRALERLHAGRFETV